jgi:hypothetical protein
MEIIIIKGTMLTFIKIPLLHLGFTKILDKFMYGRGKSTKIIMQILRTLMYFQDLPQNIKVKYLRTLKIFKFLKEIGLSIKERVYLIFMNKMAMKWLYE